MLAVWTCRHNDILATWRHRHNDIRKKPIFSLCRYVHVVMSLCCCQTSVNNFDITTQQTTNQRAAKIVEPSSPQALFSIWRLLWSWKIWWSKPGAARVDEEELAEAFRTYPIMYDKRGVDALLASSWNTGRNHSFLLAIFSLCCRRRRFRRRNKLNHLKGKKCLFHHF